MPDNYKGMRQNGSRHDDAGTLEQRQDPFADLDTTPDEAEKVKGGRIPRTDPCEGGEIA